MSFTSSKKCDLPESVCLVSAAPGSNLRLASRRMHAQLFEEATQTRLRSVQQ